MSVTALIWLALCILFSVLSLRKAVWGIAAYMVTFFAAPQLWWWGDEVPDLRYALWTGIVLLGAVAIRGTSALRQHDRTIGTVHRIAIAMVINATFVHFTFATKPAISMREYVELLKYVLLFFLIWGAIDDKDDIRTSLCAIALGAAYIGYEVTINNRGHFTHSRLEGVGAPAADTANGLASLLLAVLPMTGVLFLNGKARHKAVLFACAPLILNVIVMCNSRGAFLGLIAAGLTFVLLARGASRKKAIQVFALAGVLLYLLLGDPKIFNRFVTTFSGSEERDNSASSRLVYWRAGLRMLEDYPLGAGGGGFKWVHAQQYLEAVGSDEDARALHNGYLTEATDWGVQGLLLKLLLVGAAVAAAHRTSKRCRLEGRDNDALIGIALIAATSGFMVCCVFGSFLGNEWCYWQLAYLVRYAELYGVAEAEATSEVVPQEVPRLRALARGA